MLDSLASVKATNEEERRHFAELFNSANSAFFTELRTVIATEATSRQQDQADFSAGMEELRILQLDAAANTARLFNFQETALDVNQRIGEVQERAMANNERLADLIRNQNTAAASNLSPEDLPVSRSEFVLMFEELKTHITSHLRRDFPAPPNGEFPNTQLNTLTTLCHDMGIQLDKMSQIEKWSHFDDLMLDSAISFTRFDRLTASQFEESQKRERAIFGQHIDHLTVNLANLELQLEQHTSNLGDIAARYEKYLDLLPQVSQEHVPQQSDTPYLGHIHTTPLFKPMLARDLDRLAGEVAHVRQLTYNAMIAQMAIDESKSRLDSTSTCYDASCQHAEKVQEALKLATINLNLRQGQANSPDHSDFATTVVHDPADHDFLGGDPNLQERNETPIMTINPAPPSPLVAPLIPINLPLKPSTTSFMFYGPHNLHPKRQCCEQSTQPWAPPPSSPPLPLSTTSDHKDLHNNTLETPPLSTMTKACYGCGDLGHLRHNCPQGNKGNTPQPPPILFCDLSSKTVKRKYPIDRPFRDIFGSQANRRTASQSLLAVISHFKSVARVDILKWCSKQHIYSRCSLNTIFDIVCANPHAEVPETYYTAIKALESRGCTTFDMDIIPFNHIMFLWKKMI
jgi:hypothetical protein